MSNLILVILEVLHLDSSILVIVEVLQNLISNSSTGRFGKLVHRLNQTLFRLTLGWLWLWL